MEIRHARYGLVKFSYFGISSLLISPATPRKQAGIPPEMLSLHTWIQSSSHVPNRFFFFEREERGVFFFLNHYPGNLIHTEYNGEERGRLDRGLEEIMKFVHIQASWKVPPSLSTAPSFLFRLPSPAFPPPTPKKGTRLIALGEAEWATLRDDLVPICVRQWKVEGTNDFNFQFGLNFPAPAPSLQKEPRTVTARQQWPLIKLVGKLTQVHIHWCKGYTAETLIISLWASFSGDHRTFSLSQC